MFKRSPAVQQITMQCPSRTDPPPILSAPPDDASEASIKEWLGNFSRLDQLHLAELFTPKRIRELAALISAKQDDLRYGLALGALLGVTLKSIQPITQRRSDRKVWIESALLAPAHDLQKALRSASEFELIHPDDMVGPEVFSRLSECLDAFISHYGAVLPGLSAPDRRPRLLTWYKQGIVDHLTRVYLLHQPRSSLGFSRTGKHLDGVYPSFIRLSATPIINLVERPRKGALHLLEAQMRTAREKFRTH